ncbi:MAG TPA: UvrD-helicase domain-containing protein [Pyrinomonadaceae bacterium]|jgi:ATP-dependent exoDNAse (exonuclease V) beta subunit (contains helicase and exonuclease domains)|nr:UvrD-helicase domain-containing protein [Pyrinomonadaceae bacterium]
MSKRELLPEQSAAAYEIDKHISVTAGPGSGKTFVLVQRYLHILRKHKLNIDQIVAITFTNRAANEMRERLRHDLTQILESESGDERKRWLGYKRTLDGAVITTIHGFCARLLREFPVEAGIDPQFLLLDEHRAAMLLESVVEEVLSKFISDGHIEVSRLTLGVGRAKLAAALAQAYLEVRRQGLSVEGLARITGESHCKESDHLEALKDLDNAMAKFLAIPRTTPAARKNYSDIASVWSKVRDYLNRIPEHETLAEFCQKVEMFRELRPPARGNFADHVRTLDELIWAKELAGRLPQVSLDLFACRYALEMVSLLTAIDERLNEEKQKLSALDFDDLEVRTLELLNNPAVLTRAAERYKFFLVDEFQDTNGLQRQLLERLALTKGRSPANLFIVGDRKQSIYGFRGADVDVFREMTKTLVAAGGEPRPLLLNFRSQPPLINFFNYLFARLFRPSENVPTSSEEELAKLGYVPHEASESKREQEDSGPLVELLIATDPRTEDNNRPPRDWRELDAIQLANRIALLKQENPELNYSDIALLFRAMTQVHIYETVFRRANIPYQTVLGRGFYERDEVKDLIQLLRFLDNRTDELALAAVLRSPICGISDNALLALRSAPRLDEAESVKTSGATRRLFRALRQHDEIAFIDDQEHELLERASHLINRLVARRHHYTIEDLLRYTVTESEYFAVIAANFDGAQRLANVHRLFTLAARFERSGNHLIRDFVRYVEEFEAIGSRESEGQIDEAANAVKLMTIHQAKGLEFPVVIIPDLHRSKSPPEFSFMLDRHRGLTLKVPDGRGNRVAGCTFSELEKRHAWREEFESMRLLYVAATRAEDRLILSGGVEELSKLNSSRDSWLKWIWQALDLENRSLNDVIELDQDVQIKFSLNASPELESGAESDERSDDEIAKADSLLEAFPLLKQATAVTPNGIQRFSVTQLINYQRCARQFYFDRVLQLPTADELAVWNNAEAPEPPANLTATLKGAVIHRFCERFTPDQNLEECLRSSFNEVVRLRQSDLADRLVEIDADAATKDLLPLAMNYLRSDLFSRVERARSSITNQEVHPAGEPGLWSELSFRIRRPLGLVSGAIDKLLITKANDQYEVEIIDFKTNRLALQSQASHLPSATPLQDGTRSNQFAFDFDAAPAQPNNALAVAAHDYQLQMQAYALAIRELLPSLKDSPIRVTLHFLEPNLEYHLADELLMPSACEAAIDSAMLDILRSSQPQDFPVNPATHCRTCSFLKVCAAGREFVRSVN